MPYMHQIKFSGTGPDSRTVPARVFRDLLDVMIEGARKALRLKLQGTSTPGGAEPKWLRPAADFDIEFPRQGDIIAQIKAKPLGATLPHLFSQRSIFDSLDPKQSPVDLFEDAIEDATSEVDDSQRYDSGLLQTVGKFSGLFGTGEVNSLSLLNGRNVVIDPAGVERATQLAARTKAPDRVYVVGRLEGITYSDCRFKLLLPDDAAVLGDAQEVGSNMLRKLWGRRVAIKGMIHYRPSGAFGRLEATSIDPVEDEHVADSFNLLGQEVALTERQARSYLRLIESPPEPTDALRAAWKRHSR